MQNFSKSDLTKIASALAGKPRKPANSAEGLKVIERLAAERSLSLREVLALSGPLLDSVVTEAEWAEGLAEQVSALQASTKPSSRIEAEPVAEPVAEAPASEAGPDEAAIAEAKADVAGLLEQTEAYIDGEAAAAAEAKAEAKAPRDTAQARAIAMMRRPEGATADEMGTAFGWQRHTVRGFIAGAVKRKLGLEVATAKEEGRGLVYRIPAA